MEQSCSKSHFKSIAKKTEFDINCRSAGIFSDISSEGGREGEGGMLVEPW